MKWKISKKPVNYNEAVSFMENRVKLIAKGDEDELVWLLEHNHLYTAGTSAKEEELLVKTGIPVYQTGRGGKYTYHGPGQRIAYVILNLKERNLDIKQFIYNLEEWLILSLKSININAERRLGRIGLWVVTDDGEKKIAAIGVRIRKWVSYHGIALNISPNLSFFKNIIPCGIKEHGVTSIKDLKFIQKSSEIDQILIKNFAKIF